MKKMKNIKRILVLFMVGFVGLFIGSNEVFAYEGFIDMPQSSFRPHITQGINVTGTYSFGEHSAQDDGYRRYVVNTVRMFPETTGSVVLFGDIYLGNTSFTITDAFITTVPSTSITEIMTTNFTSLDHKDWILHQSTTTLYFWIANGQDHIAGQMFINEIMGSAYVFNSGYAPTRYDALNAFYIAYADYLSGGTFSDLLNQSYNRGKNDGLNENRDYYGIYHNYEWLTAEQWGDIEYNNGVQATESESFDAGYNAGSNDSFLGGLKNWIVPAIIVVLFLGGALTIIAKKREV